jgi:large subunit ribosomal protein L29
VKPTKPAELRRLSAAELVQKAEALRQQLFRLRLQHSQRSLSKTADLAATRRELARVLTIAAEKEAKA